MLKYDRRIQKKLNKAINEMKQGMLKSGENGKTVRSRKQEIAIGLSEARKEGIKVPQKFVAKT